MITLIVSSVVLFTLAFIAGLCIGISWVSNEIIKEESSHESDTDT